jgi:hypothetical protein
LTMPQKPLKHFRSHQEFLQTANQQRLEKIKTPKWMLTFFSERERMLIRTLIRSSHRIFRLRNKWWWLNKRQIRSQKKKKNEIYRLIELNY